MIPPFRGRYNDRDNTIKGSLIMNKRNTYGWLMTMVLALPTLAWAQSGPALLLRPWQDRSQGELVNELLIVGDGSTDNPGPDDYDLTWFEGHGRVRLDIGDPDSPAFGYRYVHLDLDTNDPRIMDDTLTDVAASAGFTLGEWEGWDVQLVAGMGFAGDSAFDDSEAVYGLGYLYGSKDLSENETLLLGVAYDGNRMIFPDVPLPLIEYQRRVSDELNFAVGLPYARVFWRPAEQWVITAAYFAPTTFEANVTYALTEEFRLFAALENHLEAFHAQNAGEHDRLFVQQRRVEAGVLWVPCEWLEVAVAGGYAFDQEIEIGFDVRDTSGVADLSDEAYLRVGVGFQF